MSSVGWKTGKLSMKKIFSNLNLKAVLYDYQLYLYRQKSTTAPEEILPIRDAEVKKDPKKDNRFTIMCASHKNSNFHVSYKITVQFTSRFVLDTLLKQVG